MLRNGGDIGTREAWTNFERKGLAALRYARRMGATYSSSTFIGLLALIDGTPDVEAGERISMFSYGSGCCAEFYCGRIGADARRSAQLARAEPQLDARRVVSVAEYEAIERQRFEWIECGDYDVPEDSLGDWYDRFYRGRGLLVFRGMSDFYRQYAWS
jgi:hydroxymethylglutaryl-CoA synthase